MQAIEASGKFGEFTAGTFPKISVDPRLAVMDSHKKTSEEMLLRLTDNQRNLDLGFLAAQELAKALRPAFPYVEVIKVHFFYNFNLPSFVPLIKADIALVEPNSKKKVVAKAEAPFILNGEPSWISAEDRTAVSGLVSNVLTAIRKEINALREERRASTRDLEHFDALFFEKTVPV